MLPNILPNSLSHQDCSYKNSQSKFYLIAPHNSTIMLKHKHWVALVTESRNTHEITNSLDHNINQ